MDETTPVELVRVPKQERYYDREAVLGRDAASVFPTEIKKAAIAKGAVLAELLGGGGKRFISETELEEIKTKRGLTGDDGTTGAEKPLAEILREAKEAKEAAFQDQWKSMKQGKNRPLDEDEFLFLDSVAEREAAAMLRARQEEEEELAAFHAAQQQQQQGAGRGSGADGDAAADAEEQQLVPGVGPAPPVKAQQQEKKQAPRAQQQLKKQVVAIKPMLRPVFQVKGQAEAAVGEPASKRPRTEQRRQQQASGSSSEEGPGLAGLLGGYGSDYSEGS